MQIVNQCSSNNSEGPRVEMQMVVQGIQDMEPIRKFCDKKIDTTRYQIVLQIL